MENRTKTLLVKHPLSRSRLELVAICRHIGSGGYLQRAMRRLSYRPYITTRELPLFGTVVPYTRCPPDLSGLWGYTRLAGAGGAAT